MMKSLTDTYTLHNGTQIPCVGFGTWRTPDGDVCIRAVKDAIAAGYRHIDTAAAYGNEESVGAGIKQAGVPREELFITTKLWNAHHGYEATCAAFEDSLNRLGLDYLDLYLIHWPNPIKFRHNWQETNAGSWKAFEEFYAAGRIRAIGVSNFMPRHLDELMKTATIAPMVNQIFVCPGYTEPETTAYCKKNNILIEAYSPLGSGELLANPTLQALAQKYAKSAAQVCLRWSLQMGFLPLPKSVTTSRIIENTALFDFELSAEDVDTLSNLKTDFYGVAKNPDTATW